MHDYIISKCTTYVILIKYLTIIMVTYIHISSVADPGFTEGGFRTVMRAMRVRAKILGATPTFDKPRPQNAFRKYRGRVATYVELVETLEPPPPLNPPLIVVATFSF